MSGAKKEGADMPANGGYDKPYYSGDKRFGRNKELTDDFTLRQQAEVAIAKARKSPVNSTNPNATPQDQGVEKKVTDPELKV